MHSILHITLVLGLLTQFTKLGDLLLLPKQQKRLQNQVELFALKIDSINPLNWYQRMLTQKRVTTLTACFVVIISGYFIVPSIIQDLKKAKGTEDTIVTLVVSYIICGFFIVLLKNYFTKKGTENIKYMYAEGVFKKFIVRFFKHLSYYLIFIALTYLPIYLIHLADESDRFQVVMLLVYTIGLILVIGKFREIITWFALLIVGFLIICWWLLIRLFTLLYNVVKFLLWRIASYNKGAVAGITLLITFLIAIAELYFKFSKS